MRRDVSEMCMIYIQKNKEVRWNVCLCMRPSPVAVGAVCSWHPWSRGFVPVRPQCRYSVRQHLVPNYTPAILPWDQSSEETHTHTLKDNSVTIHLSWCRSKTIWYDIDSMILFCLKEKTVFHSLFHTVTKNRDITASQKYHQNTLKLSICLIHLVQSCTITKLNYVLYYLLN